MLRTSLLSAFLLLASSTVAWAHVPHDPAYWVAFPPGEDPGWVVTCLPVHVRDSLLLVRSDNGQDVDLRYLIDSDEGVNAAAMLAADRLVLGTAGEGLWVSDDVGDSFQVHADIAADATIHQVIASPDILTDNLAFAIGMAPLDEKTQLGLVWRSEDAGESWQQVASLPGIIPWDIKLSPTFGVDSRAFMLTRDGEVYRSVNSGATWMQTGGVTGGVYEVAVGPEGRVWLGTATQGLFRSADDGETFESMGYDDKPVVTVAEFEGDLVMFTYSDEAVYVSNDGGAKFLRVANHIEDAAPGQPSDGIHYFELRQDGDGTIWLAAWEGLIKSTDRGQSWQHVETYLPEVVRDLATTINAEGNPAVMASTFGGGSYLSDPVEREATPLGFDLAEPFFKRVATSHDYGRDQLSLIYLLTWLMVSDDSDQSWTRYAEEEMGDFWDLSVSPNYTERPFILAAGNIDVGGGWCTSDDEGSSWACHAPEAEVNFCSASHVSDGFIDDGLAWVACGDVGEVQTTSDHGASWSQVTDLGVPIWGLGGSPGGAKLFMASHQGLYVSTDGGAPELSAFGGQSVWDVAVSPTWDDANVVFALVADSGWYRSTDGGVSWDLLTMPSDDPMMTVSLSPDYSSDRTLAVGGFDGAWYSADGGESWEQAHALELLTDFDPLWSFDASWNQEDDESAINATRQISVVPGATAELSFRGVGVDLYAATMAAGGTMQIALDGVDTDTVDLSGDTEGRVVVFSDHELSDGWHTLEVTLLDGLGVVDSAVVWRLDYREGGEQADTGPFGSEQETDPPIDDTGDTDNADDTGDTGNGSGRCPGYGCTAGGAVRDLALVCFALGLVAWRRRSRGMLRPR